MLFLLNFNHDIFIPNVVLFESFTLNKIIRYRNIIEYALGRQFIIQTKLQLHLLMIDRNYHRSPSILKLFIVFQFYYLPFFQTRNSPLCHFLFFQQTLSRICIILACIFNKLLPLRNQTVVTYRHLLFCSL